MLQALLLFALLLTGALAGHEKVGPGTDPNGHQSATPTSAVRGGTDPDGLQATNPTTDLIGGLDPDGMK